jgi:hypothetical protein
MVLDASKTDPKENGHQFTDLQWFGMHPIQALGLVLDASKTIFISAKIG